jgi:protease-4
MSKPVVASIGDIGASGAYMIASQCDEIVSSRTSSVGSIGVIAEVMNLEGLLEKVGVDFTVITAGEFKDAGSPYRSITETETALIEHSVDMAYQEFIDVVARGRGLDRASVEEMATGWVWSGVEAQEMGLVDTLGPFNYAFDRAADLGGIEGDPYIVTYDEYDPFDVIWSLLGIRDRLSPASALDNEAMLRRSLPQ